MDALQYLLLVNIYLVLFYGFYALFLKNETFFKLNRIYLVGGAIMSFLIPFLQSEWLRSLFITKQVEEVTQNISLSFTGQALIIQPEEEAFNKAEILLFIYLAGMALFLLRFIWQLYKVQLILKSDKADHAFSFFNKIEVGPSVPNRQTVYDHELVHAREWHSADVILFEIIAIVNWFNPVVYLYRKAIKYIHEFTADEIASRQEESKAAYAMVLVSKTFGVPAHQLTNSFYNHSLLKRRIIMLHKSKSTRNALLKYGLSAPLFGAMMILSSAMTEPEKLVPDVIQLSEIALSDLNPFQVQEVTHEDFMKRNPSVETINWNAEKNFYVIYLKDGRKESYDFRNKDERERATKKYGAFFNKYPAPVVKQVRIKQEKFPPPVIVGANDTVPAGKKDQQPLFTTVEVSPEPVGGIQLYYDYISKNFKYPDAAKAKNIGGRLILQFVVDKDGELSDIRVLRGLGSGLDEEAIRVLAQGPKWKPGIQNGKLVRVAYTLPLSVKSPNPKTGSIGVTSRDGKLSVAGVSEKVLYVVDGDVVNAVTFNNLDANTVKAVNVLKGESAAGKYGEKGRDGVIEVYVNVTPPAGTNAATSLQGDASSVVKVEEKQLLSLDEVVVNGYGKGSKAGATSITANDFNGLVIIDGREISNDDGQALSRVKPNDIDSLRVIKDAAAVKAYGDRGKNGVIVINLKKK